jgi:hypothetical protein
MIKYKLTDKDIRESSIISDKDHISQNIEISKNFYSVVLNKLSY